MITPFRGGALAKKGVGVREEGEEDLNPIELRRHGEGAEASRQKTKECERGKTVPNTNGRRGREISKRGERSGRGQGASPNRGQSEEKVTGRR